MTAPPIPTFVPQDAWYGLTLGQINPSEADSVPNRTYLAPSGTANGLIGSLDGAIIYLAGGVVELDGGQRWLMWVAGSFALADNVNVFNPWAVPGTAGRWVNTQTAQTSAGGQFVTGGSTYTVQPPPGGVVTTYVIVNKVFGSPTTLLMPTAVQVGQWQEFVIKDGKRDADVNPITIDGNGGTIDGLARIAIAVAGGSITLVWNGVEYNQR
jgi:hypothetical protein